MFQHHSPNLGLIRQAFQHHGPWQVKPRHEFIDTGAELTRLYPIDISSMSNHAALRPTETLNA
jgi:hypothetical protein